MAAPLRAALHCIAAASVRACSVSSHTFAAVVCMQARPLLARALSEDNFDELLDPRLENRVDRLELERMCSSAAAAVRHSAKRRPKMKQVNRSLCFLRGPY